MGHKGAHIIVLGNEKGGTGKSTLTMHIAIGLLKKGKSVAVIDLDARQKSSARYLKNREQSALASDSKLLMPEFEVIKQSSSDSHQQRNKDDEANLQVALEKFKSLDIIIIDCPGNDTYLSRLAHALADTLITPLNDSFVDLDLLGKVEAESFEVKKLSFYTELVWDSRKFRSASGKPPMDWIIVRTRLSSLSSRNNKRVHDALEALKKRIMFRYVAGLYERVIYRELFPSGLTILDLEKVSSLSHVSARQEVRSLVDSLNLPD